MGRHKAIKNPEALWTLFEAYVKDTKDNPRIKIEYVGKEGERVETPVERPLSIEGFYTYCYNNASDVHNYLENTEGRYEEFKGICTRIRKAIRQEQIEGGLTGFYNANLTARINGISDKNELKHEGNVQVLNIDPLEDKEK